MQQDLLEKLPDFSEIEKRVFESKKGIIFIGGKEVSKEVRDVLREQAKYIETSQLWEILNASLANEATNLALIQSANFEHVQFAKALWHLSHFIRNIVTGLGRE